MISLKEIFGLKKTKEKVVGEVAGIEVIQETFEVTEDVQTFEPVEVERNDLDGKKKRLKRNT